MIKLEERLKEFQCINNILSKGPLSLVMQFTRICNLPAWLEIKNFH